MALKALSTPQFSTQRFELLDRTSSEVLVRRPACSVTTAYELSKTAGVCQPSGQPPGGQGLAPGERVLLRDAKHSHAGGMLVRRSQSGGIAVTTMPLLRNQELATVAIKARIKYASAPANTPRNSARRNKLHRCWRKSFSMTTR